MDGRQGNAGGCHVRYRRRRQAAPLRRRQRQQAVDPNAVPPSPVAVAVGFWQETTPQLGSTGRRSVPPPPPRCPPGTAAAAASLGPNAVPPSPVAATVDRGPETAAAARRHVVLFKSPSVQQRRTTLPGLGACLQGPPIAAHTQNNGSCSLMENCGAGGKRNGR